MSINPQLSQELENVRGLPSPPRVAMQIIEAARDPDISLTKVADLITSDPVIAAKIMRMSNSAAYAVPGGCNTLRRALLTLGLDATLIVALSFSLAIALKRGRTAGLDHEYYWRRSLLAATAASATGKTLLRTDCEALFLAALLQDIGMLALDKCRPELYAQASGLQRDHQALAEFEFEQLQCNHADVGGWLMNRWNLPQPIVDAVARSHDTAASNDDQFARCVALSGPLADVWLASDWTHPFHELVTKAVESLGLDESQICVVLDELRDRIPETEAMFEKDLLPATTGFAALAEARELIMERGVKNIIRETVSRRQPEPLVPATLLRMRHRAELNEILNKEFTDAKRENREVGVVLAGFDSLDHFRETHGAGAADRLLRETARIMLSNRGSRVVGQFSRNEIVLWLTDCNHEAAQLAGRRILRDFDAVTRIFAGERGLQISLTLGIAAMDAAHGFSNVAGLLRAAHGAMERARLGSLATNENTTPALSS